MDDHHLLNVRADDMSAFAEDPTHFTRWAEERGLAVSGDEFLPRMHYARYLQETLERAAATAPRTVSLEHVTTRCVGLRCTHGEGPTLALATGRRLEADDVVLALGNLPPLSPGVPHPRVVTNPWRPGALDDVEPDDKVLVVGTGLTAIDVVISLRGRGHTGAITAVSRTGLLPRAHGPAGQVEAAPSLRPGDPAAATARGIVRTVRAAAAGEDWRSVVDALRPVTIDLWQQLPLDERERFVRHTARWWEVHRHRMAPQIDAEVRAALAEGALEVRRGRVRRLTPAPEAVSVEVTHGGATWSERYGTVVLCTGPIQDPTAQPVLADLLRAGAARPGPLDLGLDVSPEGRLCDRTGRPQSRIWAVGTIRRGVEWECTAVPELREQAATLADEVLTDGRAGARRPGGPPSR